MHLFSSRTEIKRCCVFSLGGNLPASAPRFFFFSVAQRRQRPLGWAYPCRGSLLPGFLSDLSLARWSWQKVSPFPALLIFLESPIILKVRPSHVMLKLTNLICQENRLFSCKISPRKGRHYPSLEILSYFESNLTESPWFSSRGPKGKEEEGFLCVSHWNIPISSVSQPHSKNTLSSFYQLKPGTDMWCVQGCRLLFSASGISC